MAINLARLSNALRKFVSPYSSMVRLVSLACFATYSQGSRRANGAATGRGELSTHSDRNRGLRARAKLANGDGLRHDGHVWRKRRP